MATTQSAEFPADYQPTEKIAALGEEAIRLDLTMTIAKGSIKRASDILEWTPKKFQGRLKKYPLLVAKWWQMPGRPSTVNDPDSVVPFVNQQVSVADATAKMQQDIDQHISDLEGIGLENKTAKLASAMGRYHVQHLTKSMSVLNGGLMRSAMESLSMVERLREEPYPDELSLDGGLVRSGRRSTDEMILRALDTYGKRVLEFAQAESLRRKLQSVDGAQNKKGKPRFGASPMRAQILAQPGSNVTFVTPNHGPTQETQDHEEADSSGATMPFAGSDSE